MISLGKETVPRAGENSRSRRETSTVLLTYFSITESTPSVSIARSGGDTTSDLSRIANFSWSCTTRVGTFATPWFVSNSVHLTYSPCGCLHLTYSPCGCRCCVIEQQKLPKALYGMFSEMMIKKETPKWWNVFDRIFGARVDRATWIRW